MPTRLGIKRIVSGGQTGVDRAALDVAIKLGIPHGGWCPRGRLAEDGPIPTHYRLEELASAEYSARTRENVIDSDGTLILYFGKLTSGTALTNRLARAEGRPLHRIRLDVALKLQKPAGWILDNGIETLNIAGPRASSFPEIYDQSFDVLSRLFATSPPLSV